MGGLQPSDLVILAGRPSMGKTALATNIAYNIARAFKSEKQPDGSEKAIDGAIVGFFSLEMSAEQLATRILSEQAEIASEKIRRGMIDEREFGKLVAVSQEMSRIPLYIDQTGGLSIAQLRRAREEAQAAEGARSSRRRLSPASGRQQARLRGTRPGGFRDYHGAQGAGQGAQRADHRALPALAPGRAARRQAAPALGPA